MCYFDCKRWRCGFWKWDSFRLQCHKEYRMGETCGQKLIYHTELLDQQCRLCDQIEKKNRRLRKMWADMERWRAEGNRRATVEKTERDYRDVAAQISQLQYDHARRLTQIDY